VRPVTDLQRKVAPFQVITDMVPAGDQPTAIAEISRRIQAGDAHTVLLGATGTGKTASIAPARPPRSPGSPSGCSGRCW